MELIDKNIFEWSENLNKKIILIYKFNRKYNELIKFEFDINNLTAL